MIKLSFLLTLLLFNHPLAASNQNEDPSLEDDQILKEQDKKPQKRGSRNPASYHPPSIQKRIEAHDKWEATQKSPTPEASALAPESSAIVNN